MGNRGSLYRICLIVLSLCAVQCGKKLSKSSPVEVTIVPDVPIVITASIEGAAGKEAPWFSFKVSLDNQTDQAFEIVALQIEISGQGSSGQLETRTLAFDPSQLDYTLNELACSYGTFGVWQPGQKKDIGVTGTTGCLSLIAKFYAGGNPKGPNANSYRYRVKAKPLGYFIDAAGDPDDRFEKFKYFFTK